MKPRHTGSLFGTESSTAHALSTDLYISNAHRES
jgi:hypothetical protein